MRISRCSPRRPAVEAREEIRRSIAALLEVPPGCVNVKATTTEKMGFLGRGEGIAAQADRAAAAPLAAVLMIPAPVAAAGAFAAARRWTPRTRGRLRVEIEDFIVEEDLGFSPDGDGQHVLLQVKKRNANTGWVAPELARAADCRAADVGFAGPQGSARDRHAVVLGAGAGPHARGLAGFSDPEFEVLEACPPWPQASARRAEGQPLPDRVRDYSMSTQTPFRRARGDRDKGSTQLLRSTALRSRRRQPRAPGRQAHRRGRADGLRALERPQPDLQCRARERVRDGSWERLESGDVANLDGRGSVFEIPEVSPELLDRCRRLDIHPTGPLWGRGELLSKGRPFGARAYARRVLPRSLRARGGGRHASRSGAPCGLVCGISRTITSAPRTG